MASTGRALWAYGTTAALGRAAVIFLVGLLVVLIVRAASGWPGETTTGWVVLALLLFSLMPVVLLVLDFLAERRAVLGTKWFNLDLSRVDLARTAAEEAAVLPANLGVTGPVVSDTTPMDIMADRGDSAPHRHSRHSRRRRLVGDPGCWPSLLARAGAARQRNRVRRSARQPAGGSSSAGRRRGRCST